MKYILKLRHRFSNVNFKYKVVHLGSDGTFTLNNVKTEIVQPLDIENVRGIFAYCSTCHSAQGSSIDDTITIFGYKRFGFSLRYPKQGV